MFRKLLVILVVALVGLLVVADRVVEVVAGHLVASHVRTAAQLGVTPSVTFEGFPFLTQAIAGDYREVSVTVHGLTSGGLRIATLQATLYGIHAGLGAVLSGHLQQLRIDRGTGSAFVTYADLDAYPPAKAHHITVTRDGTEARVTGTVYVAGAPVTASGDAIIGVQGRQLLITPMPAQLQGAAAALPPSVRSSISNSLAIRVNLSGLPFGVVLRTATVEDTGIAFTATATGLEVATG